jgi:hypothetical protein
MLLISKLPIIEEPARRLADSFILFCNGVESGFKRLVPAVRMALGRAASTDGSSSFKFESSGRQQAREPECQDV